MIENWKDLPGYEGRYQVSTYGQVRSIDKYVRTGKCHKRLIKGKVKSQRLDSDGRYLIVDLSIQSVSKTYLVHRLIGKTFLGLESSHEINHKDGVTTNNHLTNLEVTTRSDNEKHKYRVLKTKHPFVGKNGSDHVRSLPVLQIDLRSGEVIKEYGSGRLAENDGYISSSISLCCNGKQKSHKGYIWKFKQPKCLILFITINNESSNILAPLP